MRLKPSLYIVLNFSLILFSFNIFADFIPENIERYPTISTEKNIDLLVKYTRISNELSDLYQEQFDREKIELTMIFQTDNDKVNAYARRPSPQEWTVVFTGGLLRHPRLTPSVFATIYCHELGHHCLLYTSPSPRD